MSARAGFAAVALALLSGCAGGAHPGAPVTWRSVVTEDDGTRLMGWRQAWIDAFGKQDPSHADPLLDPDRALAHAMPPAGAYRCKTGKYGITGGPVSYPAQPCRITVDGTLWHFTVEAGDQRPDGWIYPHTDARMIFLGTMVFSDELRAHDYGQDQMRDMAGYVERIGPQRWRLVLPYPHYQSTLDVIEITPAG